MKFGAMAPQMEATNYYEILEVAENAPSHEIHRAYTRAKATYSSDNPALYSMFSAEEARELLRMIEEAYSILGNPSLRKSYDEARARGERSPHVALVTGNRKVEIPQTSGPNLRALPANALQQAFSQPSPPAGFNLTQIVSDHRSLPDFADPSPANPQPKTPPTPASARAPLPEGTGRTQLSTFKIDESFEEELRNTVNFDGTVLQRVRIYKNVSIDRLSEATRISRPYLTAVESNDYKSLPAAVFTRGFVVQIARALGLNENHVASSYIKLFKAGGGK